MRKIIVSIFLISAITAYFGTAPTAHANESKASTYQQPGEAPPVSTVEKGEVAPSWLQQEGVAFQPQFGMMNYKDTLGNTGNRATYGFTMDSNLSRLGGMPNPEAYIGPQLGFFFSHLGAGNSGFFGSPPNDQAISGSPGTNAFFIPTDLKLGYNLGNFRPSLHGGANLFYTSVAQGFALGSNPNDNPNESQWKYLPNLGLDLEYAVAKNVEILARPDITFAGSNRVWNASIGASIPLG